MRAEKQFLLDEIKERIVSSTGFVVAKYQNIGAVELGKLRDDMFEVGADFEVVKKRVFQKAAQIAGIEIDISTLDGHVSVLFAKEDAIAASKLALKYGKEQEGTIEILGGYIEGELLSKEDVTALALLPSKDVLRAQLLGLLVAPMTQTLGALNALLTAVPYCLEGKVNKS